MVTKPKNAIKPISPGVFIILLLGLALSGMASAGAAAPDGPDAPVGTAFTYQGRLSDGGAPGNGAYDLRFSLFDDAVAGAQIGSTQSLEDVLVADSYFTVTLDFGISVFEGDARWIEVKVRPGPSTGSYTTLSPRTSLAAVPYALGLMPGAVVSTSEVNVPAITVSAPYSNSNALAPTKDRSAKKSVQPRCDCGWSSSARCCWSYWR